MNEILGSVKSNKPYWENRFDEVVSKLSSNRLDWLVDIKTNPQGLKILIERQMEKKGTAYDKELLEKCFGYIDKFFGDEMRKSGKMLYSAHVYAVAYGAARLGLDFETVLIALFHDCIEDAGKYGKEPVDVAAEISEIAGSGVAGKIGILTKNKNESYETYLERIYRSENIGTMVVKALDTIHNLATLYYDCPDSMRDSVVGKAVMHADIWRKLNRELFEVIFTLIEGNETERISNDTRIGILALSQKSIRQIYHEKLGLIMLNIRGNADLNLIRSLPDAGTSIITIYVPSSLENRVGYLEIEFPEVLGTAEEIRIKLGGVFNGIEFELVKSKLPDELACTHIFRTDMPPIGKYESFVKKMEWVAATLIPKKLPD